MKKKIEITVGFFMLLGIVGLILLAFRVSGLQAYQPTQTYHVSAAFDTIGGLRVRAPLRIAGVRIGEVTAISLDPKTYRAKVVFAIAQDKKDLPIDSSLSILTEGLLGTNYVNLTPGFDSQMLKEGDQIQETHPAIILESLIGHFLYQLKNDNKKPELIKTGDGL
jgi:phospholipid/cholesterol/gamma-HCH transport system substrate-binding protein